LAACRPGHRLSRGGAASALAPVSKDDLQRRYGAFLGFAERQGLLKRHTTPAASVTRKNVKGYLDELQSRVSSVTTWLCIYRLRRMSQILAPQRDFGWLREIERELALVMQPRAKFDRLVFADQLLEAGLTLILEAKNAKVHPLHRAQGIRNGLMIALLALSGTRIKNFAALCIGGAFKQIDGTWWVALPRSSTKSRNPDERSVPSYLNDYIDLYLSEARPVLLGGRESDALWISSRTGQRYTAKNLGTLISKVTLRTLGVDVSPHLFRTAMASTASAYLPQFPGLASALLNHRHSRVTDEHYIRANSIHAGADFSDMIAELLPRNKNVTPLVQLDSSESL
jgi:site-specific recombinase XerD